MAVLKFPSFIDADNYIREEEIKTCERFVFLARRGSPKSTGILTVRFEDLCLLNAAPCLLFTLLQHFEVPVLLTCTSADA
jgi:hypothetical protein